MTCNGMHVMNIGNLTFAATTCYMLRGKKVKAGRLVLRIKEGSTMLAGIRKIIIIAKINSDLLHHPMAQEQRKN